VGPVESTLMSKAWKYYRRQVWEKEWSCGAFEKLRIASCLSVCPHGSFRLPKLRIFKKLDIRGFSKICRENPDSIKIGQEYRVFYMKTKKLFDHFWTYIAKATNVQYYNVLSYIIHYQYFSIVSGTTIRVALHE